jgi:hypothetical protein
MEFIIGLFVVAFAAYFLFFRTKKTATPEVVEAPYKVETTTVAAPVAPVVEEVKVEAPAPVVEATPEPVAIVVATPAKAPRKPRAAKPAAAKVVKEKAPAKAKAPKVAAKAPAKKPAAIKAKSKKA